MSRRSGLNTSTQAWATVPSDLQGREAYDGVFQNGTVFLGGSDPIFNKGITLVHEVGHVRISVSIRQDAGFGHELTET